MNKKIINRIDTNLIEQFSSSWRKYSIRKIYKINTIKVKTQPKPEEYHIKIGIQEISI